MSKNQRFVGSGLVLLVYTFLMGVFRQNYLTNGILIGIITIVMLIISVYLGLGAILRFGQTYINKGDKHKENLMNAVIFLIPSGFLTVFLYTIDVLESTYLIVLYVITGITVIYILFSYIIGYVQLTKDGIKSRHILDLKGTEIQFKDVTYVTFSSVTNSLKLHTKDQVAHIDIALTDSKLYLEELSMYIKEEILKEAFEDLRKYYQKLFVQENVNELTFFKERE